MSLKPEDADTQNLSQEQTVNTTAAHLDDDNKSNKSKGKGVKFEITEEQNDAISDGSMDFGLERKSNNEGYKKSMTDFIDEGQEEDEK